ncbi:MAG: sulfur oxidation c-type cytochrome SoxA [Rhodobacteraceae bacterium]|nr:sulfur oxidation c-type cytochrome SoxA [Paracoccaceae bacterium]
MKKLLSTVACGIVAMTFGQAAFADPDNNNLTVEGMAISTDAKAMAGGPLDQLFSGWRFRASETQSLQMDDFDNPSFVFVEDGEALYDKVDGSEGKACSSCHEDVAEFKDLRPTLPRWNEAKGKLYSMEQYINDCRVDRMGAEKWKWTGTNMTAMTSLISLQSRGMPISVATDGPVADILSKGKEIYYTRVGQLDMSCANCHEDNFGNMIRADHLSQGQTNGFPTYRLKNAKMNSIHARFKGCMKNIRAKPFKPGGAEFQALELYVASRGNGLAVESPSVRN